MEIAIEKVVASNVVRLRHEQGFSQQELADKAGLSRQTVSAIENGHPTANLRTLSLLADALGVLPAILLMNGQTGMVGYIMEVPVVLSEKEESWSIRPMKTE